MSDAFGDYLRSIGRIPLLTPQEEVHLGMIVKEWMEAEQPSLSLQRRGRRALQRMVTANLRLAVTVALRYIRRLKHLSHEPMDLVQAGNIGLLRAAEKYDPTRGYKFSTYGYWWIRQSINRYLQEHNGSIRLPVNLVSLAMRAESLQNGGSHPMNADQLADELGETPQRVLYALAVQHRSNTVSLDQQFSGGDGEMTLLDTVTDTRQPEIEDDYVWMRTQLDLLSTPERTVIQLRYGSEKQRSFAEVARLVGRTKDQVQRLERHALTKLRRGLMPVLFPG
ncbi:RNA polymerase sigma factor RpoD/SigA [Vulcanococcus sp.]|jgi:RNA polymerase sigma factor (sigma-70 family)|uniref:RNA polymerase sigma factor RpoD/SigA n=1 Tax=Vulcanococcus sp. TaxID=2856995 RepID=UPI0037D9970F